MMEQKSKVIHSFMGGVIALGVAMWHISVLAVPVDLSSWTVNGNGDWELQSGGDSVLQKINSPPTIFHNGTDSQNTLLRGSIEVQTSGDDDFIGFVLGYQDGELFSDSADYYLVDWKQANQSGALEGMAFSHVTGDAGTGVSGTDTSADLWNHAGVVNELARASTLGSTGWSDNTEYLFEISFTATNIQVLIDDIMQFNINGTFGNGAFGFYNFSQSNVLYAGIQEEDVPPDEPPPTATIPAPNSIALFGLGMVVLFWKTAYRAGRRRVEVG